MYLRMIISSETTYSADDLELNWTRKLCLSQHGYPSEVWNILTANKVEHYDIKFL